MPFNHVREVIEASRKLGHVKNPLPRIWNLKIGALMESLLQSAFAAPDFRSDAGSCAELPRHFQYYQRSR
jgi:hypothetical protein